MVINPKSLNIKNRIDNAIKIDVENQKISAIINNIKPTKTL